MIETETDSELVEVRTEDGKEECPTCKGSGKIKDGSMDCPDCNGTGEVAERSQDPELERRQRRADVLEGTREQRQFPASQLEVRETSDGMLRFTGYASATEHDYEVADFTERIARGAFKRTLAEGPDTVLLINHDGMPLARTKSGTLTLTEDARGLRADADLDPADPDVQALVPKLKRGDLDQMSFAFRVTDQEWNEDYDHRLIRSLSIHRGDVSVVTMGANEATTASVIMRSEDGDLELRVGKELSKTKEAKIKGALEKMSELGDDLAELLPKEPDPPPVTPWQANKQDVDHTTRARQDYDYLQRKAQEEGE